MKSHRHPFFPLRSVCASHQHALSWGRAALLLPGRRALGTRSSGSRTHREMWGSPGLGGSGTAPRAGREQGVSLGQLLSTEKVSGGEEAPCTAAVTGRRGWGASRPWGTWPKGTPVPLECLGAAAFIKKKSRGISVIFSLPGYVLALSFLLEGAGSV